MRCFPARLVLRRSTDPTTRDSTCLSSDHLKWNGTVYAARDISLLGAYTCGCLSYYTRKDADFHPGLIAFKAKGRTPFRELAPSIRFRRPGSVPRSQPIVPSELFGTREPFGSRFLHSSAVTFVARAFSVPPVSFQLPECVASPVAGSLNGPRLLSPSGRSLFR